jgi:hypothetical protein
VASSKLKSRVYELLLLLVIVMIVFFLPNIITIIKVNFFTSLLDVNRTAVISMPTDLQSSVYVANESVLIGGDNLLSSYNKEGQLVWQRELRGNDTQIRTNQSHMLIAELIRGEIVLLNLDNEVISTVKDIGKIEKIDFSSQSHVALKLDNENRILVYDENLELTADFKIPLGDIIDMQFSESEEIIMLSTISLFENNFESFVLQYDTFGRALGSSDCEGQLVYSMHMSDFQLLVTDETIKSFSKEAQLVKDIESPGLVSNTQFFNNRLYANVIKSGADEEVTQLLIYADDLSSMEALDLPSGADGLVVNERFIAVYVDGIVTLYDHGLIEIGQINTQLAIKNIQWIDNRTLVVNDNAETLIYELH